MRALLLLFLFLAGTAHAQQITQNGSCPAGASCTVSGAWTFTQNMATSTINSLYFQKQNTTNLFVGSDTLPNASGAFNTITGIGAGAGLISATAVTAYGYNACNAASTSTLGGITCIGSNAGSLDNGTTGNVYIGDQAGQNNVSGNENVYIGRQSGINATGSSNTVIGLNSFTAATSGSSNTIMGQDGGKFLGPTSAGNTLVGTSSGKMVTGTGSMNYLTGLGLTTFQYAAGSGDMNSIAIGNAAMRGNTNGTSSTGGTQMVAIGTNAALNYTSATQDVIIGHGAGIGITAGSQSVLIGTNTGNNITTGGDLIMIGNYRNNNAITGVTSGTSDAIGIGNSIKLGNGDIVIGLGAYSATTTNGLSNLVIGTTAGNKITSGGSNLILGMSVASTTLQTGTGNILIGTSSAVDTLASGTSNEINIGNLLYYNSNSLAAPVPSACGTSPSIDSHANNRSGTVTVGSVAAASCTVTFAGTGYSTWNHCRVTPQTPLATFAYSYTKAVLTVTATSLIGEVFDYDCDGV